MRQKIAELNSKIKTNEKTIEGLRQQLIEAGIRPNGAIPKRGAVRVSTEEGELGELETKSFSLQKKICSQEYFINSMRRQLANK